MSGQLEAHSDLSPARVLPGAQVLPVDEASAWTARLADYVDMTKPRIAVLVLVTVGVGAMAAVGGAVDGWLLLHTVLGTAMVASSASVFNQVLELRTDALMRRTAKRPVTSGRISKADACWFGGALGVCGTAQLWLWVNAETALLGVATWVLYVAVYTPLKRRTTLNTLVGAAPGAMPALMGWTATGSDLTPAAWGLFLIVFLWQFPHFMAIAWLYRRDYAQAGLKMLPSVDSTGRAAAATAVLHALVLFPVGLFPAAASQPIAGPAYFAAAVVLGLAYLAAAFAFWRRTNDATARVLLRTSLIHLPLLLLFLVFDPPAPAATLLGL